MFLGLLYILYHFYYKKVKEERIVKWFLGIVCLNIGIIIYITLLNIEVMLMSFIINILLLAQIIIYSYVNYNFKKIEYKISILSFSGILLLKTLFSDSVFLKTIKISEMTINLKLISFIAVALLLYYLYSYFKEKLKEKDISLYYIWSATGVFLILLFIQFSDIWISITSLVFATLLLFIGIKNNDKILRLQGIIIIILIILKISLYDTRYLDTVLRTFSYIGLGVFLLIISFVYTKYKKTIKKYIA